MPVPKTKGKYKMSGSVSYSRNESHQSEKYHEYYLSYYRKEMAQASLNWDWVQKTVGDSTGIGWAALLSEEVNDILNNPGSELYQKYAALAEKEEKVIFGGRLGEYKYYDMDKVIEAALNQWEKMQR